MDRRNSVRIRHRFSRGQAVAPILITVALLAALPTAWALDERQDPGRFDAVGVPDPSVLVSPAPVSPELALVPESLRAGWESFKVANGEAWDVHIDARSGVPLLVQGRGIPLIPGSGNTLESADPVTLEALAASLRRFMDKNVATLGARTDQLVLNRDASGQITPDLWQVTFDRQVAGIQVAGDRYLFHVGHGNLIAFGATRWSRITTDAAPSVVAEDALALLLSHMGVTNKDEVKLHGPVTLTFLPSSASGSAPDHFEGAIGTGYETSLIWQIMLRVEGEFGSWVGLVDAHDGKILAFYDLDQYAQAKGGVFPLSNDGACPDGCEQPNFPMPYANITIGATNATAGSLGFFACTPGGSSATTTLAGPYVRVVDACGAIAISTLCDTDLDLESSAGTDCAVPAGTSSGDTHAARSSFYHLNRIAEHGRAWLPSNAWLTRQLTDNVNINLTCNANFSPYDGSVNFYRSGGGCRNTGEIAGVFLHEWGHGLDYNDGGGWDNPIEGYADITSFLLTHKSCIGRGFRSTNCSGNGNTCLACTGVRDQDWNQKANHAPTTPEWVLANCPAPGPYDIPGPCGKQPHCESYPGAEALWDLAVRDLPAAGLDAQTAWQLVDRLWFRSRTGSGGNSYTCGTPVTSRSCAANSWYSKMRVVDDDDGNLANGTPHAAAIFAAFNRHNIPCGLAGDATNQNRTSCPALAAPTLTTTSTPGQIALSWTAVAGASSYNVLRNDQGCGWGFNVIGNVAGTAYTDTNLPNGLPLYYAIQPIGANTACTGTLSTCRTAQAGGPHAVYSNNARVADRCPSGGAGDGDGTLDAGETVQFSVTLRNDGTTSLTGVTATVTPTVSGVVMLDATASYSTINAGALGLSLTPHFTVRFPETLTCGSVVSYTLTVNANEGSWTGNFTQTVGRPTGALEVVAGTPNVEDTLAPEEPGRRGLETTTTESVVLPSPTDTAIEEPVDDGNAGAAGCAMHVCAAAPYYPRTVANSHLASGRAGGCMVDGYTCQILRNEELLPRAAPTNIVMHGGGHTPGCSAMSITGCDWQAVEVYINDPTMFWADWCLVDNEAYTLTPTDRYDFRGVSVQGCTANPFDFEYEFLCRSDADCVAGDRCTVLTGRCNPPSLAPISLDAGYAHSVSAHNDGTVWAWGMNTTGQLGDSTLTNRNGPVRSGTVASVVEVGAGVFHTIALKSDGTVWAWGDNSQGQLGNGTTTARTFPGQVPGLTGVVAIASGFSHTLALKSDGTVWAWGDNWGGQVGDGTTVDRLSPFQLPGVSGVASLAAGAYHSLALKSDGTVLVWGRNAEGELGDGTHTDRLTPGPVPGLGGVKRASCGAYFTIVIMADGTMKAWGHNYYGELGDGTTTERTSPVSVSGMASVARIAAGSGFSLALRGDGTVWSWGQNVAGQLGDGTTTDRSTPARIAALSGIVEVAAGEDHSLARNSAGIVYGWGKNLFGQIGPGTWPQTTPIVITDETQPAPLGLVYPVGGEAWVPGSSQTVSWTGAGPISVKISHDGGANYTTLVSSTSQQDVPISVPANWSTGRGRVRIERVGTPASFAQTGAYLRIHPPQQHAWLTMTVDGAPEIVGEFAQIALDPWGRTGIAYFDRTNGDLKFALRSGTSWTIETVDAVNTTGWYASLAFGADGSPRIAYMDGTRTYLRYAYKSAGAWVKEDVADTSCTLPVSLAFDTVDRPFIAIQDCSSTRVRLFAKSGTWSQIYSLNGAASPSLAMYGNLPRISYFSTTNPTQLRYLYASGTFPSFTWSNDAVAGTDGANWSSIVIDSSGNPRISFYAATSKSLRMAKKIGSTWSVEVVDASVGDVGNWSSIALDSAARPRISYLANGLVKVAEWNGSAWQLDVVDVSGDTPAATAIAVDAADNDRIAYFDTPSGNLRYAISQQDVTAPAAPALILDAGRTTLVVSWAAPGDDGTSGTASAYDFRKSQTPINASNFSQATIVPTGPPGFPGSTECFGFTSLPSCTGYFFGLKVLDDLGNESQLVTGQISTDCSGSMEVICE